MMALVYELFDDDEGHGVVEYALIASVILLVCVVGADAIGGVIAGVFQMFFGPVE